MFTLINTSHARASENDLKNFISFPIWGLSVFITNSSLCTKRNFWNVGRLINQPSDILVCDNNNTRFWNEAKFNCQRNCLFATNSNFLIPISWESEGGNPRYFKLRLFDLT